MGLRERSMADNDESTAKATISAVGDQLNQLKEGIGSYAKEKAEIARERAGTIVDEQKGAAAEGLRDTSDALREASDHLRSRSQSLIAGFAQTAADKIEGVAVALRERDVGELIDDAQTLA